MFILFFSYYNSNTKKECRSTPILVKDDTTAEAVFEALAYDLLREDIDEIDLVSDSALDKLNSYLKAENVSVHWFVDLEVNNYVNFI